MMPIDFLSFKTLTITIVIYIWNIIISISNAKIILKISDH